MKKERVVIIDTTSLIHLNLEEIENYTLYNVLIPEAVKDELKSRNAILNLSLIETILTPMYVSPSKSAIQKAQGIAKKTGDLNHLSKADIAVIALALEYTDSIIISDDKAIQNVCHEANIMYRPIHFKIKRKRKYFWKCTVCGKRYNTNVTECLDCGSPVKRYYQQNRL